MRKVLLFKNVHKKGGRKRGWKRRRGDEQSSLLRDGELQDLCEQFVKVCIVVNESSNN